MPRDILFLLKPNMAENGRVYHCPECATIEGVLAYHPNVRYELDVQYVDFARPRPAVISLLGEENQGCPVLVLNREHGPFPSRVTVREANGHRFIAGPLEIALAMATAYGTTFPH
jgi:hypothetical protein